MPLRKTSPIRFSASGVCDALDATDVPGAMALLTNLIPDPADKGMFQCRPAAVQSTAFGGFTAPTYVSVLEVFGSRVYGMVSSGRFAGKDEPFVYDLLTSAFITVTGVLTTNVPTSPSTTGTWSPPTVAIIGAKVLFTHPGFSIGSGNYFGVLDISTPATPAWSATNTTGFPLVVPPTAVAQFNNRAYWLVNPGGNNPSAVYASDVLAPTVVTSANVINFDDNVPCNALAGLPLNNQQGGIIQSLMVFKGTNNVYQITGDPAIAGTWARNTLNIATGTLAPRSICITPEGLAFAAPDGLRMITFTAQIGPPLGEGGNGIVIPFEGTLEPTRIVSSANAAVLRVSLKNASAVWQEYWFDLRRQIWTGPHPFASNDIDTYVNTFICAPVIAPASLWQSDYLQSVSSVFTENGVPLTWTWQTSMLPDPGTMSEFAMIETTLNMTLAPTSGLLPVASMYALDQSATQLGSYSIYAMTHLWGDGTLWGGGLLWGGVATALTPQQIKWTTPIVFRRLAIKATGPSLMPVKIGDLYLRYQALGYLQQ